MSPAARARPVRLAAGGDGDEAAPIPFEAELLQPLRHLRRPPGRNQQVVELEAAAGGCDGDAAILSAVGALDGTAAFDPDALAREVLGQLEGDLGVFGCGDAVERFEDGHFGAEAAEGLSELEADGAAADDGQAGGEAGECEDRPVGLRPGLGEAGDGREAGAGAGRDDDVGRLQDMALDFNRPENRKRASPQTSSIPARR